MEQTPTPLVIETVEVAESIVHGPTVAKVGTLEEFDVADTVKLEPKVAEAGAPVKLTVGVIAFATEVLSTTCGAAVLFASAGTFNISTQTLFPVLAMV